MGRYDTMFAELARQGQGAFVPFVVIGDPVPEQSIGIIRALVEGGADALELGIPFSDPIADGPTIQAATQRALKAGVTPDSCFQIISDVRKEHPDIPIGLLVYANLVVSNGEAAFYRKASASGVDSVLVADVPVFEAEPFARLASDHGIEPVLIAPPNADNDQLRRIAKITRGYTYVVARPGVTGADDTAQNHQAEIFNRLASYNSPPCLLGFGISQPDHVSAALKAGAAGAISGSAVVRIVERRRAHGDLLLEELKGFVRVMKGATFAVTEK